MRVLAIVLALGCAACSASEISNASIGNGPTAIPALVTTADYRLITNRPSPKLTSDGTPRQILCAEPSPDIAKALEASLKASASVTASASAGGSGSLETHTIETITQLAGRTTAVVALRDGLFRACEAYANGMLGDNAYAIILSRYGDTLLAVMLADKFGSAPPAAPDAAPPATDGGAPKGGKPAPATAKPTADAATGAPAQLLETYIHPGWIEALLVSCVTEHDPTRRFEVVRQKSAQGEATTFEANNKLLTVPFCQDFLRGMQTKYFSGPAPGPGASARRG